MPGRRGAHAVYAALAGLLAVSGWAALRHGDVRAVDLFAANLATETLGLIVTLLLVHRYLERQERALRLRGSLGAVRRAGRALAAMVDAWTDLVKGTLERAPEPAPTDLRELVAPDLTAALAYLDPALPTVAAALDRLATSREALRGIIATHGSTLDPIYLGAIDDLIDDPFLALVADGDALRAAGTERSRIALHAARYARLTHFDRLTVALDYHNQLARDAARLRDLRTAPRGDGYSPAVPLDFDLRVHAAVAPEWWFVAPRPGALRSVRIRDRAVPEADAQTAPAIQISTPKSLRERELAESGHAVRGFPVEDAVTDAATVAAAS